MVDSVDKAAVSNGQSVVSTGASVRQTLGAILTSDSDLNAFCLDYFPHIYRLFSSTMDRTTKENLLLVHAPVDDILFCLRRAEPRPIHLPKLTGLPDHSYPVRESSSTLANRISALRLHPQPPRCPYDDRWYVARPDQEHKAQNALNYRTPVVLYGPELYGKTWLLQKLLGSARQDGYRVATLNLQLFEGGACKSLERFLHKLAFRLLRELELPSEPVDRIFTHNQGGPIDALNEILRQVLRGMPGMRLVLAIDNVDQIALAGHEYQDEFFSLLRAWADASDGEWIRLHLVLCISTAPALLIKEPHRSPFNLGDVIHLTDFDEGQLAALANLYGLDLGASDQRRLRELVGGHPYLARLALYETCRQKKSLHELLERADTDAPDSLFSSYLEHLRSRLHVRPDVRSALDCIVQNPFAGIDDDARRRLDKAGIVVRERRDGRVANRLRHRIYSLLVP